MNSDIIIKLKEQLNIVSINRDIDEELSRTRLKIRQNAIKNISDKVEELKNILSCAQDILNEAITINENNNKKIEEWNVAIPLNYPKSPELICENINGIKLIARKINYLDDAGPDLCFMPSVNRFIIRFAGETLIGNIGNIYDTCAGPERVRECRYATSNFLQSGSDNKHKVQKCSKTDGECKFYHNPFICPSSREPRNFFATCGHYMPNDQSSNYLRYGNRNTLIEDLSKLTQEERRRFDDFVAHLVLCWIIMKRAVL